MRGSQQQGLVGHHRAEARPVDDANNNNNNNKNNKNAISSTASLSPMLRHRQEPLPFILPQPLGPLPTPAQSVAAARLPNTAPGRDLVLPASFSATKYQRDAYHGARERHPPAHQTQVQPVVRHNPHGHNSMTRPFSSFSPPPPDLTRRQSLGSLSSQNPTYLPPPLPSYPVRRSTSPVFRQDQTSSLQPPAPALTTADFTGNSFTSYMPTTTTFWPSPPPTAPQEVNYNNNNNNNNNKYDTTTTTATTPGMAFSAFPGSGPPRPARAAEYVRYQCDQCPENFPTNGILKRHKKTHSARKYRCGCGAAYTDKSVLRVSINTTTYQCRIDRRRRAWRQNCRQKQLGPQGSTVKWNER